jgi:hypothetical protein
MAQLPSGRTLRNSGWFGIQTLKSMQQHAAADLVAILAQIFEPQLLMNLRLMESFLARLSTHVKTRPSPIARRAEWQNPDFDWDCVCVRECSPRMRLRVDVRVDVDVEVSVDA